MAHVIPAAVNVSSETTLLDETCGESIELVDVELVELGQVSRVNRKVGDVVCSSPRRRQHQADHVLDLPPCHSRLRSALPGPLIAC